MTKPRVINVQFPIGGIDRSGVYVQQTAPYTVCAAINMRAFDGIEVRNRGGVRCGLTSVSSLTPTTSPAILTDSGVPILTEDGNEIVLSEAQISAGMGSGGAVSVNPGDCPPNQTMACLYRERLFLSGENNLWYASRQGDFTDWNFGADSGDVGRAVAGACSHTVGAGEKITAMIPHKGKYLVFGTKNGLWIMNDDPTTGELRNISSDVGIISPLAWCKGDNDYIFFLSNKGICTYIVGASDEPTLISRHKIPVSLINVNTSASTVTMGFDCLRRAVHVFITPPSGLGEHWCYDLENRGFWKDAFQPGHQPVFVSTRSFSEGIREMVMHGRDGTDRKFSESATNDDGVSIKSHVLFGPFSISSGAMQDGLLTELHATIAESSANTTWNIISGCSPESVADTAETAIVDSLAGTTVSGVVLSGTFAAGHNRVVRPRVRSPWGCVWISSSGKWAFGSMTLKTEQLGRYRG